jgi:RNA polymerase sigma factor (sigma-70 family)
LRDSAPNFKKPVSNDDLPAVSSKKTQVFGEASMPDGVLTGFLHRLRWSLHPRGAAEATDTELLRQFLESRDEAAFVAIVQRHGPMILGLCRRLVVNPADADDAFQATFLVLVRRAGSIRKPQLLGNWLYGVAHRVAVRARMQAARRRERESSEVEMIAANPVQEGSEWSPVLHEELNRLPEKYRAPMVLCYLQGKSNQEAADVLGWPVGTVKGRLTRARELLKKRLTRRGVLLSSIFLAAGSTSSVSSAAVPPALADATVRAALLVAAGPISAAGVSTSVAALTKGVAKTMFLIRLTTICGILAGGGALGTTAVVVAHRALAGASESGEELVVSIPAPASTPQEQPEFDEQKQAAADEAAEKNSRRSQENLKTLALAMHNYLSVNGQFPPAAVISSDGKSLLSWRVLLLPYLDQNDLYSQFKLDEPWDSPNNKKLLDKMPEVFSFAPEKGKPAQDTVYQVFTGPHTIFPSPKASKISDITDGTSNTILITEAAESVPWSKPADLSFDPKKPLPKLGGINKKGFRAAIGDGSVRFFKQSINEAALRKLITCDGGEVIDPNEID